MRGRTNIQGFDESSLNADVVNAIADETINSGSFVKFYNAINGGYDTGLYFHKIKKMSDGRLMCIGADPNSTPSNLYSVVILEQDSSGNFVKNLPTFTLDFGRNDTPHYDNCFIDIDEDTVAYISLSGMVDSSYYLRTTMTLKFVKFDVINNQVFQNDVSKEILVYLSSLGDRTDIANLFYAKTQHPTLRSYGYTITPHVYFDYIKINNVFYIVTNIVYGYSTTSSGSLTYYQVIACVKIEIESSSTSTGYTFNCLGGRVFYDNQTSNSSSSSEALYCGAVYCVYSSSGNGIFISYQQTYNDPNSSRIYLLGFVSLEDFIDNESVLPQSINFGDKFSDISIKEYTPLGVSGDYVYFIRVEGSGSNSSVALFKIYFYNYTRTGYSYLIYDAVETGINSVIHRTSYSNSRSHNYSNISLLYENSNIKRFFVAFKKFINSATNNRIIIALLIDIDKEENNFIVNPSVEINVVPNDEVMGYDIDNIYDSENDTFVTSLGSYAYKLAILNDSELGGFYQNILHVLNATDENFIQGVAKQSGSINQIIECYKARVV